MRNLGGRPLKYVLISLQRRAFANDWNAGVRAKEMAARYGMSVWGVKYWAGRLGLPPRDGRRIRGLLKAVRGVLKP